MATVYVAEDLKHHPKVAIKVLRPELAAGATGKRSEVRSLRQTYAAEEMAPRVSHDGGARGARRSGERSR